MLILKTLALEPMHGYGIAVRLEQMGQGVFRVNAGSLFVAFQRLERAGLTKGEWKATENSRRAKCYALADRGRKGSRAKPGNGEGKWQPSRESWKHPRRSHVAKHNQRAPFPVPKETRSEERRVGNEW